MLDADGALEFAGSAGGALEGRFLRKILAEQRLLAAGAEFVEVAADAKRDFFGVENFAGVERGAMFGAASAFDAGVGLERDDLGEVLAGIESEILIADQRGDLGESAAREENGRGAQHQVEMLGVRDQRHEDEKREGVGPPDESACPSRTSRGT